MSGSARKSLGGAALPPLADLFSTSEERQLEAQTQERVLLVPLAELHDFPNHPFEVRDDEEMQKLADSIEQHGILMPGMVRPRAAGGYEIVAGHRRKFASLKAHKETMPVIVREMDDDTAVILMVDSNVQRENVLPSERAKAYKMKLEALKRQGERTDLTSAQVGQKLSVQKIAEDAGESKSQVQRIIHLNELVPELLEMVDKNKLKLNPAYELSFLKPQEQAVLFETLQAEEVTPSLSQAQRMKRASQEGTLTSGSIADILCEEKAQTREAQKITLAAKEVSRFFPPTYTPEQQKKIILKLLSAWARQHGQPER